MGLETIVTNQGKSRTHDGFGGYWERGYITELITLSTSGRTTDSSANLLPADSIIEAVTARVTTAITTATQWRLGDATNSDRFCDYQSGVSAGSTVVGLNHLDEATASPSVGVVNTTAAKLRITTNANPGAGAIRVVVYYRKFVAPTS